MEFMLFRYAVLKINNWIFIFWSDKTGGCRNRDERADHSDPIRQDDRDILLCLCGPNRFSIEGLRDIVESQNNRSVLLSEPQSDYKPLAKAEELEEQNYNQIDNVLNNTKPGKAVRPEDRPPVIERMKTGKKELDARNAAKAQEPHELNTEKAK